jgi:anti-anti-sigma factor
MQLTLTPPPRSDAQIRTLPTGGCSPDDSTMFTVSRVGDSAVVSLCCSKIDEGQAQSLRTYLLGLAHNCGGRLAVELAGVRGFTCAWINVLLELSDRCEAVGGKLVLFGLRKEHRALLGKTGLAKRLAIVTCRTKALEMLGSATIAPWRLALARLFDIPVAIPFEQPARTGRLARAA